MAKIHEIGIGAETRAFEDNIKRGVIKPTEEAEKALKELGDTDAGRDAARDLEKLEDKLKDAQRQTERMSNSMDDLGDNKGITRLKDGAQEVTQEVGQNLGEAVSSIRGDISDLGQVGQDTLGGLAATLAGTGPAGIAGAAALAAGAVGLGLITAEVEKQNERVQQLKGYFSDAWREAVEGGRTYIDTATVIGEMNDIIFNQDRADEYKRIQEDAASLSLDTSVLLRAAAGDQDALNEVMSRTNALQDDQAQKIREKQETLKAGQEAELDALHVEEDAINGLKNRWQEYGDISAENQQKARDAAQTTSDYLLKTVSEADSATKAVDDFGNTLITLPDGQEIVIDAKTGKATADVSKFKTDTDGVINHLNGRQISLVVRTALRDAQNQVNNFIKTNEGRSFKIHGRFQVDSGRVLP